MVLLYNGEKTESICKNDKEFKIKFFLTTYLYNYLKEISSTNLVSIDELLFKDNKYMFQADAYIMEYYEAIYVISPISVSIFFTLVYGFFATIEFYFDKNKFAMIISGLAAVIKILLNLIFIPLFGYQVAGYTTMICYIILAIGHVIYTNSIVKKQIKQKFFSNKYIIGSVVFISFVMITANFLYKFIWQRYIIILIIFLIIFIKRDKIKNLFKFINKKI